MDCLGIIRLHFLFLLRSPIPMVASAKIAVRFHQIGLLLVGGLSGGEGLGEMD